MGDLPLRHEGRQATFDELQLRHQHGILHCLTIFLSLRNTGTTTLSKNCTRTRKRSLRELPPLPLPFFFFLFEEPEEGLEASWAAIASTSSCDLLAWRGGEAREGHERHELRLHHLPLLSPLPLLLLLLLLLLQRQVLLEEESEGGAVDAVVAAQRRHHQERSVPRGVPHGAVLSAAARGQRDCPAAPPGVEASVPVGRRAAHAPLPPRPWPSSVPLGQCGASSRPGSSRRSSCRSHERSRRCRRLIAAPAACSPCNGMSTTKGTVKVHQRASNLSEP